MATFTPLRYGIGQVTQHTVPGISVNGVPFETVIVLAKSKAADAQNPPILPTWSTDHYTINAEWDDAVAAYITDNDIIRPGETVISWPDAQSRLNFCTHTFLNESKDFKEDTVSWPSKMPTDVLNTVYADYLDEDNGMPLETDSFLSGITSEYTARAKAEYTVRASRGTLTYAVSVNRDYLFLEPGDIVKLQSDVLGIPKTLPQQFTDQQRALYGDLVVVREVKPDSDGAIKLTLTRYDAGMLAWNVADNEKSVERRIFDPSIAQASGLYLSDSSGVFTNSAGLLRWTNSKDPRVTKYSIKLASHGIPSVQTHWMDLGEALDGAVGFDLQGITANKYLLTVVAMSATRAAPKAGWPVLDTSISTARKVSLACPGAVFTYADNVWNVPSITLTAVTENFKKPIYTWFKDGVVIATSGMAVSTPTLTVQHFDTVGENHKFEVVVGELDNPSIVMEDSLILFSASAESGLWITTADSDITLTYTAAGVLWPKDQLPIDITVYVVNALNVLNNTEAAPDLITYSITNNQVSATINSRTGVITITDLLEATGDISISATVGGETVTEQILLKKSLEGEDSAAKIVKLIAEKLFFIQKKNGAAPTTDRITLEDASFGYLNPIRKWSATSGPITRDIYAADIVGGVLVLRETYSVLEPLYQGIQMEVPYFPPSTGDIGFELTLQETDSLRTVTDKLMLFSINEGEDTFRAYPTEPVVIVNADWDGAITNTDDIPFDTQIHVMRGSTEITNVMLADSVTRAVTFAIVTESSFGITGSTITTAGVLTVGNTDDNSFVKSAMTGRVLVRVTINRLLTGGTTDTVIDAITTVTKSKNGQPAYDATFVTITPSALLFIKKKDGTFNLPYIDLTADLVNYGATPSIVWENSGNCVGNTQVLRVVPAGATAPAPAAGVTIVYASGMATPYSVEVTGTALKTGAAAITSDNATVLMIEEGSDAYAVLLSNENIQVPSDADGNPHGALEPVTFAIAKGVVQTAFNDIAATFSDSRFTRVNDTIVFSGFNTNEDQAACTVHFSVISEPLTSGLLDKIITFYKVKDGAPAVSPPMVTLSATSTVFIQRKDGTVEPADPGVTLGAQTKNIVDPQYSWTLEGNVTVIGTGQSIVRTSSQFNTDRGTSRSATYRCNVTGTDAYGTAVAVFDLYSLYYAIDGDDAVIVALLNENQSIPCDATGIVKGGYSTVTTQLFVVKGTSLLNETTTPAVAFQSTVLTAGIPANNPNANGEYTFDVSNMVGESASIAISCIVEGTTLTKSLTLNRTRDGGEGSAGLSVFTATVYYQGGATPTVTAATGSYNFNTNTLIAPTGNVTWLTTQPPSSSVATYSASFTFKTATPLVTVSGGGWSAPIVEAVNGANGEYRDIIQLYLQYGAQPTKPTSIPYTFSTNSIGTQTGGTAGWSMAVPASSTTATYITTCLASTTTPASAVTLTNWTTPVVFAKNGADGSQGPQGNPGAAATKTSSGYVYYSTASATSPGVAGSGTYTFSTGAITGLNAGWSAAITPTTAGKYWAASFVVTESYAGSNSGIMTCSAPFTTFNFDGLVTFTNLTTSIANNVTAIDGGKITTGTIGASVSVSTNGYIKAEGTTTYNLTGIGGGTTTKSVTIVGNYNLGAAEVGVAGLSDTTGGWGVFGEFRHASAAGYGVVGCTSSPNGYAIGAYANKGYSIACIGGEARFYPDSATSYPSQIRLNSDNNGASPGILFRNDNTGFYILKTAAAQGFGNFDSTRPFSINISSGAVKLDSTGAGVVAGGNITCVSLTQTSDDREKCEWQELPTNTLEKLANVKHGSYAFLKSAQLGRQVGVSAQDLQKVLPEAVTVAEEGGLSVAYGNAALVSAILLAKELILLKEELKLLKEQYGKL